MIAHLFPCFSEALFIQRFENVISVELTKLLRNSHLTFISKFPESGIQGVLPVFGFIFLFALLDQLLLSKVHHDVVCYRT